MYDIFKALSLVWVVSFLDSFFVFFVESVYLYRLYVAFSGGCFVYLFDPFIIRLFFS